MRKSPRLPRGEVERSGAEANRRHQRLLDMADVRDFDSGLIRSSVKAPPSPVIGDYADQADGEMTYQGGDLAAGAAPPRRVAANAPAIFSDVHSNVLARDAADRHR